MSARLRVLLVGCVVLASLAGPPALAAGASGASPGTLPVGPAADLAPGPPAPWAHGIAALAAEGGSADAVEFARTFLGGLGGAGGATDDSPMGLDPARVAREQELELALRLLALRDTGPATPEGLVALAKEATRWQASALGLDWAEPVPLEGFTRPSDALFALGARHGVAPSAAERASIRLLDEAPAGLSAALARFVDAFLALETSATGAFLQVDAAALARVAEMRARVEAGEPSSPYALLEGSGPLPAAGSDPVAFPAAGAALSAAGIDISEYFPTRNRFLDAVLALGAALEEAPLPAGGPCEPTLLAPVFSIDLASCDSVYTNDLVLLFDGGGDDRYLNNAGGSGAADLTASGVCQLPNGSPTVAAALVDWRVGADRYGLDGNFRCGGVNGGGAVATGFLYDAGGDDAYRAFGGGVNGGGTIGAGFLLDVGGDDAYVAGQGAYCPFDGCWMGSNGVNGGASMGSGLLVDGGGADRYEAGLGLTCSACDMGSEGVNGGASLGAGFLFDAEGRDEYRAGVGGRCLGRASEVCLAGSLGVNGGSFGGHGFLFDDGDASDLYLAGTGAFCGFTDRCQLGSAGVNGGGVAGRGFLFDAGGSESYLAGTAGMCGARTCHAGYDGANGGGAAGSGILVDLGGDDLYGAATGSRCTATETCRLGSWAVNGGGLSGGVGLLVDPRGHDAYDAASGASCSSPMCVVGAMGVNGGAMAGFGALLDGAGDDRYTVAAGSGCVGESCHFGAFGANGGVGGSAGGAHGGAAFLVDASGTDQYRDALVDCMDCTVLPKELAGVQLDVPPS